MSAVHLLGGEMRYECLGGNQYKIILKTYRDCSNADATPFDSLAVMTIFEKGNPVPFSNLKPALKYSNNIPVNSDGSCYSVLDRTVCLEEGVYELIVELPISDAGYIISNQRCCRNVAVSNLVGAGNTGATFMIEITAEALMLCNSSPRFENPPPVVTCAGRPMDFQLSAVDIDGDSLVYEFCSPFTGGGNDSTMPWLPTGVAPDPSTPPPYDTIVYKAPLYSVYQPMSSSVPIQINSSNGIITGIPNQQGQFVAGVCVKEYRNGVLLSISRRDFQFNIYNCSPIVKAVIENGTVQPNGVQEIVSCGIPFIRIENASDLTFVDELEWRFNIDGDTIIRNDIDFEMEFPGEGSYSGVLVLNPNSNCQDSLLVRIVIKEALDVDFDTVGDLCLFEPIRFQYLGVETIDSLLWDFGDGTTSRDRNPQKEYLEAGNYSVQLVSMRNACRDTIQKMVNWYPVPEVLKIETTSLVGCAPFEMNLREASGLVNSSYSFTWDLGNGMISNQANPTIKYENAGVYTISLRVESPSGCVKADVFDEIVQVATSPQAFFEYTTNFSNLSNLEVSFVNKSLNAFNWFWEFGDGANDFQENPIHNYQDTGYYEVQLDVLGENGCRDTFIQKVKVFPEISLQLPNAFSPNGDGKNDVFKSKRSKNDYLSFNITIWNRYGALIFESTNPDFKWDGRHQKTGKESPLGVYLYKIEYQDSDGSRFHKKGFATLVR